MILMFQVLTHFSFRPSPLLIMSCNTCWGCIKDIVHVCSATAVAIAIMYASKMYDRLTSFPNTVDTKHRGSYEHILTMGQPARTGTLQ